MTQRFWTVARRGALALALTGLAAAPAAAQTLTVALRADIRGTNPGVNRDDDTDAVTLHMVEGLVAYREGGTVGPMLAQSVATENEGRDYVFTLRPGIAFHNGAALTAEDVVWSWNRYMDPKTDWRCRSDFDGRSGVKVEAVTAEGPLKVRMRLAEANALFLFSLARTDCGSAAVIHRDSLNPDGSWKAPVGTGPFRFGEWRRGQQIVLGRFDGYRSLEGGLDGFAGAKRPLVAEVKFLVVPDAATVKAGLLSGQIDVAELLSSDVPELRKASGLTVYTAPTAARHALLFQTNDPVFKRPAMRKALAAAIDAAQLVSVVSELDVEPNNSTIHARSAYRSEVQKLSHRHDLAAAKKLLAEAGYKGERLRITTNNRKTAPSFNIAVVLQQMFAAVGIQSDIDVVEWATHMDRFLKGNYQLMVHSYSARLDPALSFEHFTGPKADQPRKVWDDPEVIALLDRASRIEDQGQRQAIFDELHKRMIEDVPLAMLFNSVEAWGSSKRVTGFVPWESRARAWEVTVAR